MTELDRGRLERVREFLAAAGETVVGDLGATLIAGGRSNLTYQLTDGVSDWVLRRPPAGGLTPSAHDTGREFRVNEALYGSAVPVARPVAFTEDTELIGNRFSVVEYVPGRTIRSAADLEALSTDEVDRCVTALIDTLVALHRIDFAAIGLDGFGRTDGYGARQLRRWSGQWQHMALTSATADRLLAALTERVPEQTSCSIVHGDYRVDNTLLRSDDIATVVAVVDWELSTLGDPAADVAMMCAYRHPALDIILGAPAAWTSPALPSVAELAARYEQRSARTLVEWDFYLGLAYYKLAVIAAGIDYRYRAGGTTGEGFATAGDAVPVLLDAGLEVVEQGMA